MTPITKSPPIRSPDQKKPRKETEELESPTPSPMTTESDPPSSMGDKSMTSTRRSLDLEFDGAAKATGHPVSSDSCAVMDLMVA